MITKILEYDYKGFHLILDEEGGWKCIIGEDEIKFPYSTAAESAIDKLLKEADQAIEQYKGVKIKHVSKSRITKSVEVDSIY